jgi:tetratricopeptide (TPR) repeat protein
MFYMKKILDNLFGKGKTKRSIPDELQIDIVLGKLDKAKLLNIQDRYILQGNHYDLVGTAFRNMGEYGLSEKAYLKAVELSPELENPYANLLSLYILQKKYDLCESIYNKGMHNITDPHKQSAIVYQDGRLQFAKGDYSTSLSAAHSVLNVEKFQHEGAFVLAIHSLLSMIKQGIDRDENCEQAFELWKFGLSVFPDSEALNELSHFFTE